MSDRKGPRRVVLIADEFPAVSQTFIAQRFERLLARGWDIHVVCDGSTTQAWSFFPGLKGFRSRVHARRPNAPTLLGLAFVPLVLVHLLVRAPLRALLYVLRGWRSLGWRVLRRLYRDEWLVVLKPDVVHFTFGSFAVGSEYLGDVLGCALVVSFQGADLNYAGLEREPGFYSGVWQSAHGLHFLGEDLLRRAVRRGYAPDERASVIVPGVDLSAFRPSRRVHEPGRPLRILSVGRLHWKKGYEYAFQAIRQLLDRGVDLRYRIIGDGAHREAVLYARADLGLVDVVELLGARTSGEVREEMQRADVFLHAATSEGFCYAVVEAQAMELPVVTSDADGLSENVADGETGFVVPRRDPRALAEALARLAADPELRERMGRSGRKRVLELFEVDREIEEFERLYLAAVQRHGG
jgi:colanic acid/amylovoran biosynthesis glycosyltransferase